MSGEAYPDWEAVYRDNVDRMYGLMFSKVGNRADAEDLTAEVFLAALRPLRVSASKAEVRAYLGATGRTVLAGHWRRTLGREVTTITDGDLVAPAADATQSPESSEPAESAAAPATPVTLESESESESGSESVGRARLILAGLPERYRRILVLRFLDGYSVREAATALGVTVGNAKVLQHRALRRAAQIEEGQL